MKSNELFRDEVCSVKQVFHPKDNYAYTVIYCSDDEGFVEHQILVFADGEVVIDGKTMRCE